jgi:DNA-binding CsgD family transcriptional regulator
MDSGARSGPCQALESEPIAQSRPEALAQFEELLSRALPEACVVEVIGDRWGGKTALLKDFARVARDAGWRVAAGSAATPQPGVPFGVFAEALNGLIGRFGPDVISGCPPEHVRWLGGVFPALAVTTSPATPVGPAQTYHVLHAIRRLIGTASTFGNLLLLLDDMHWADDESVALLAHLLRHPPDGKVVIVVAQRPRQSRRVLRGQITTAVKNGTAHCITLAPLSEQDAMALLPGDLSAARCADLLDESGGNPGLLRTLPSLPVGQRPSCDPPPKLPSNVLVDCLRDFRELSDNGRLVARAAAVLDEPFEPGMLKEVAQLGDAEVWAAIDELVTQDVIRLAGTSSRLWFANRMLRATAYHTAGPGWILGAHARVAEMLMARGEPAGHVARHLEHTAVTGDEDGARLLLDAAREHLWANPLQAASWARTALDLQVQSVDNRLDHRVVLAKALGLAGWFTESLRVLDPLVAPEHADTNGWGEAMCCRARVRALMGRLDEARTDLAGVLATVRPDQPAVSTHRVKVVLALDAGTVDEESAKELAASLATSSDIAAGHVSAVLAAVACQEGDHMRARQYVSAAAECFDALSDADVVADIEGLYWLAHAEAALGEHTAALAHCERGLRMCEQRRLGGMVAQFAVALGRLQLRLGDVDGAVRHAACGRTAATRTRSARLLAAAADLAASAGAPTQAVWVPAQHTQKSSPAQPVQDIAVPKQAIKDRDKLASLSVRELEIAVLVSAGRTNQQIARTLELSHKTVETYLSRIFKKLIVSSRAEVAATVGRFGPSVAANRAAGGEPAPSGETRTSQPPASCVSLLEQDIDCAPEGCHPWLTTRPISSC